MTYQFLKEDGSPTQEATILEALWEAKTPVACWVEDSEILWKADASRTLHEFAIWCAEEGLIAVENPDPRSLEAIRVKKLWLDGEATDEELKNTRGGAWFAARNAAWEAAWYSACEVAKDAAWFAAWANAKGAAKEAARNAAEETQNKELERRLNALMSPPTAKRKSRWDTLLENANSTKTNP